jgi:hypothetical protein
MKSFGRSLLVASLLITASCRSQVGKTLKHPEIDELEGKTIPENALSIRKAEPTLVGNILSADWRFDTEMNEAEYLRWCSTNLRGILNRQPAAKGRFEFSGFIQGDAQHLTIVAQRSSGALNVAIHYEAYPD